MSIFILHNSGVFLYFQAILDTIIMISFYSLSLPMTKKEYILKILDALTGYRSLARGLKILVDGNVLDDKTIDSLVDIFAKTIDEINDSEVKSKLQNQKTFLNNSKR